MTLRQLNKLNSINGDVTERNRILKDVEKPEEARDVVTKEFADARYVAI